ncbi:potassium-transporting ATPase C chain [Geminocystis sp. NIES-3708]|uniref:K(+)-transporting ATPase subunit C n=1 Tax=Geminocystis sp. NIES-3708 TaxID=1615909 RepID=UPI0005FC7FC5|nr:K(+)-transporting ATPase subunit C [Geminocystis sp. NIES-3708]BAQ60004.1 potassium-transporting ATPase C chain [Geminocystis sp. NIES-3708]
MISVRDFSKAIRSTFILWIITAVIYPLLILLFGQLIVPFQANGSLIKNDQGNIIGSSLIGQPFQSDKYFWSRASTIDYSTGENAGNTGVSGASNLAPSNPDLVTNIQTEITKLQQANINPTADLVYTSGSGLDPHISIESAQNQINRVATARNLDPNKVELLINKATEGRFLGVFGEPCVNVLKLNIELNKL